jgi:hypothetical protein
MRPAEPSPYAHRTRGWSADVFDHLDQLVQAVALAAGESTRSLARWTTAPRSAAPEFANVTRAGRRMGLGLTWLLICTRACVPCSCRAAVPVHTQHCCVVSKYATTGIDHGLC